MGEEAKDEDRAEDLGEGAGGGDAAAPEGEQERPAEEAPQESAEGEHAASDSAASSESTQPADDDLTAAVRDAQAGPYMPGGKFQPPDSLKILIFVILGIAGFFIYTLFWTGDIVDNSARIRHRTLEQHLYHYEKQQAFLKANGYVPAGKTYKPLTTEERAELEGLRDQYGRMKIVEPEAPADAATQPAATAAPAATQLAP